MATLPEPIQSLDIKILQGVDFSLEISVSNGGVAWTGLTLGTITGGVRRAFGDDNDIIPFTITPHATLTHKFTISLPKVVTGALNISTSGSRTREGILGVYDVKVVFGDGRAYRLLQGNAILSKRTTA